MLGSKSKYFFQSAEKLKSDKEKLSLYLQINNYSIFEINIYLKAFSYFCDNPSRYDGATIVKDLYHIPGLDINAMLHDWLYIIFKTSANFYVRFYSDWLYAKEMERTGKGFLAWMNFSLLLFTYPIFTPYVYLIKGKRCTKEDKLLFFEIYKTFTNKLS